MTRFHLIDAFETMTVSTIYAPDIELYETMVITQNGEYLFFARYSTEKKARIGHKKALEDLEKGVCVFQEDTYINEFFAENPIKCIRALIDFNKKRSD